MPAVTLEIQAAAEDDVLYRQLFLSYPDALLVADDSGRIALSNAGASALFGYAADELLGMNVDTLVPDGTRPKHAAYRKAYSQSPRSRPMGTQMNLVARRRDGSEVMVEIALSPLQIRGRPFVVAAIRDIGAYPRVKQALRRARYSEHLAQYGRLAVDVRDTGRLLSEVPELARDALEADLSLVYLLESSRLRFRLAARAGAGCEDVDEVVPHAHETLPGFVVSSGVPLVASDDDESHYGSPTPGTTVAYRSNLLVPLHDRGEAIGVLSVHAASQDRFGRDEVRFLESLANLLSTALQRAQTEEALGHAQRLEAVGQLTGGIAHDFNNLLTILHGNLQALEELPAITSDPIAPQLVDAATRAARRGAELTGQLLTFSRRQRLRPDVVDLSIMLPSMAAMLRRTLDQRIHIEVDVTAGCPCIRVDPGQLESALLNIAINARDAMPDGGTLRFEAESARTLPKVIVDASTELDGVDQFVGLSVSDTGSGMSDRIKERAFEPFFTTKDVGRGTGLGLSTVYGFARQSQGAVVLHSVLGEGSRIVLYLPAAPEGRHPGETETGTGKEPIEGLRVLLVEDDPEVRSVAFRFLEAMRCEVVAVSTGEEALEHLRSGLEPDVLVTDIALGAGLRGTRLAELAVGQRPGLSVLLVSGYSSELLDADRSIPAGWELLQKPYSREDLAAAIARIT